MGVAALLAVAILAQASPEAGARGPEGFAIPGHRVHVFASEELNADSLGALARPGVVLWLETRSNALRPSTVERLRRFEEAWVEVRPPFLEGQALSLRSAPKSGLWLRSVKHLESSVERLGIRRLAVDVDGEFADEALTRLLRRRVSRVRWNMSSPSLESYARFLKAPGATSVVWGVAAPKSGETTPCLGASARSRQPTVVVASIAHALALSECGGTVRVQVAPNVSVDELAALFRRLPTAELEIRVDADERKAMAARRLLERLEVASGTTRAIR